MNSWHTPFAPERDPKTLLNLSAKAPQLSSLVTNPTSLSFSNFQMASCTQLVIYLDWTRHLSPRCFQTPSLAGIICSILLFFCRLAVHPQSLRNPPSKACPAFRGSYGQPHRAWSARQACTDFSLFFLSPWSFCNFWCPLVSPLQKTELHPQPQPSWRKIRQFPSAFFKVTSPSLKVLSELVA